MPYTETNLVEDTLEKNIKPRMVKRLEMMRTLNTLLLGNTKELLKMPYCTKKNSSTKILKLRLEAINKIP